MTKLILSKKDYIKVKNDIVVYIEKNVLFYIEISENNFFPFLKPKGYFYRGNEKSLAYFYENNEIFNNSYIGNFIYNAFFNKNFDLIKHKKHNDREYDRLAKNRIIDSNNSYLNDLKTFDFINFIYCNQKENELFFTIKKEEIENDCLIIYFKDQKFNITRSITFSLKYNKLKFINSLIRYKGIDFYKDEDNYNFILLNSQKEDFLLLEELLSDNEIYSIYCDNNVIYLKYKDKDKDKDKEMSSNSIIYFFPTLRNKDIKDIISKYDRLKCIDSYYYISNNN